MSWRGLGIALGTLLLGSPRVDAWPADLSKRIAKDAVRLVPRSLADLILANETEVFADARTTNSRALAFVYLDLPRGRLSETTRVALGSEFAERRRALLGENFRAAVIALGATYRLAVDLSDPCLGSSLGTDLQAKSIRREFYLFVDANMEKIPLVVVEPDSMSLALDAVPQFLDRVAAKSASQATLLRSEAQERGRVLRSAEIDFQSPIFAVASTAYSRSVSAVAATWIAIWRSAGGDMNRAHLSPNRHP